MHNLGEFMKGLLQRYTQWHNRKHSRTGRLWEDRFKSVIVEDGVAADAALWSGNISRAYRNMLMGNAVEKCEERVTRDGKTVKKVLRKGVRKDAGTGSLRDGLEKHVPATGEIPFGAMLRCRVRYFTDGAVIGSREFVNEAFTQSRERFGSRRRDGARRMRGNAGAAAGMLWSLRDLRSGVT